MSLPNKLTSIPNLQPTSNNAPTVSPSLDKFPSDSARTRVPSKSPTKWYHNKQDSDDELLTPKKETSFDLIASTPLFTNKLSGQQNVSLSSPMSKFHNLHLNSQIIHESDENSANHSLENGSNEYDNTDEYDDQFDDYYCQDADEVHVEEEGENDGFEVDENRSENSSVPFHSAITVDTDDADELPLHSTPPVFINSRKRHNDSDMNATNEDMEITNNTSNYSLKLSFSDSTPCPQQPKRKKLRFKGESPSEKTHTTHMLNLSSSIKTSATSMLNKLNDVHANDNEDDIYDLNEDDGIKSSPLNNTLFSNLQSTPISQSTPANSRAPSPPPEANASGKYTYVTPVNKPFFQFAYKPATASTVRASARLKQSYNQGDFNFQKYQIVGEFPVSSAGLMDENKDVHIGDKRINDPYLGPAKENTSQTYNEKLRLDYFASTKLPILPPKFHVQDSLPVLELNELVTKDDVLKFYELINEQDMKELLKQERIRWHPDKWIARFKESDVFWFDMDTVHRVSQILNNLIEELN